MFWIDTLPTELSAWVLRGNPRHVTMASTAVEVVQWTQPGQMAFIFRSMRHDGDKPEVGSSAKTLGARLPPSAAADVVVDSEGNVAPGKGGMSVVPEWRQLF